ncbi:MAG: hypothetical protein C0404_04850 [Verrucomicrobia bacterium]|nr:hypothetical protein [Verrucomicrobiota bacterium]
MSKKIRIVVRDAQGAGESAALSQSVPLTSSRSASGRKPVVIRKKSADPRAGERLLLNRYQIEAAIGDGGSGVVYRARDTVLNVVVAVKAVTKELLNDEPTIRAFKEEARIAMSMSHPGIVRIHNMEQEDGQFFLVMEYVEGRSMRDILNGGHLLHFDSVWRVIDSCCAALEYAHRKGVLHNDLKPENIMICRDLAVKIIDFGVAMLLSGENRIFRIVGTPAYMSPEQIRGEFLDVRTDVYAMGVILHEFLTGQCPFGDDLDLEGRLNPETMLSPKLQRSLLPVIGNAIAFDRTHRWATIPDFRYALSEASASIMH